MTFKHLIAVASSCTFLNIAANATVKLPWLFQDSMVMQQQMNAPIWGWTDAGKKVKIATSWDHKSYTATADAMGKFQLKINTPAAGGPFEITLNDGQETTLKNILIGEVWLCTGQSNMEFPMRGAKGTPFIGSNEAILKSANANLRLFTVPKASKTEAQDISREAHWLQASPESVAKFSATGYYFGRLVQDMIHVPVGLITIAYGGSSIEAWMNEEALKPFPEVKIPAKTDSIKVVNKTPTTLYNAMLHSAVGFGIKGVIWYQGESNYDNPDAYEKLFPAMVKEWRRLWSEGDFPFYYCQIAPYNYAQLPPYHAGGKFNSAYLRDAQRKAERIIPNSGMAVLMDIGEEATIHPMHKQEGGERLAYLALAKTYGIKGFGYASPAYDSVIFKDSIALVKLTVNMGSTSFGKPITTFEIAGADKVFYPANAVINGNVVSVSARQVKQPVAVRYAFKDFVTGDLFGIDGLPVSSFRTDEW